MTLLARLDRARGGLAADAALYGLAAAFALVTALTSTLPSHRAWGAWAVLPYLVALSVVVVQLVLRRPRWRMGLTWAAWCGAVLLPLIVQAVQRAAGHGGRAQEEVHVVEQMGERLASTGTPYLGPDAIAALPADDRLLGYAPYQPGMAVFGLPRAMLGDAWFTDARVWFAVATAATLVAAGWLLAGRARPAPASLVRAVQFATVLPICALTLATGGDDLPVLALALLALACCATGRYGAAGLAVGAAAALKLFALPIVVVLAVLAIVTGNGRRFLPGALGLPVLALVPAFLVDADAFVENVIRFPLGHGLVTSPAQSPFPGYLISQAVPGGRYVAVALLVAVALAIAVLLIRRPPRTAATAALFCGYGLLAAILLMPTTRFGYLLYPLALLVWAPALAEALSRSTGTAPPRSDPALYRL
ncbi:glycosyltransferase 87 family protein [Actinoplanes sp. NPDC049668]|uniref:glycosyltransferase 87 family protein n=1 Tax=unclassified Actinoplanes TaxID=2626549 RepID=UPI0033AE6C05